MTKITTQASLRFAQQVACKQLELDCSNYDFLFTIRALPGIVGGPSASAAASLLTSSLLLNKSLPKDVAMTGTINSGGLIGPVGGLKYKIEAAGSNGIRKVFLPKGTSDSKEDNVSTDLIKYGKDLNLSIVEVASIDDVLELVLDVPKKVFNDSIAINNEYSDTMRLVALDLCNRFKDVNDSNANLTLITNFTSRADEEFNKGAFYSAASFCFRANVEFKRAWYVSQNFSNEELNERVVFLREMINDTLVDTESRNISTLTDVQTFMAVMERLIETEELLDDIDEGLKNNRTDLADSVGFAEERLFSAVTWSRFFNGHDKVVVIDDDSLKNACSSKISEAEERYNYVKSIFPEALDGTRKDIDYASAMLQNGKFITCIYTAAKAKSEADVLLSLMGVEEDRFNEIIDL